MVRLDNLLSINQYREEEEGDNMRRATRDQGKEQAKGQRQPARQWTRITTATGEAVDTNHDGARPLLCRETS